jgi:hypothetical protein
MRLLIADRDVYSGSLQDARDMDSRSYYERVEIRNLNVGEGSIGILGSSQSTFAPPPQDYRRQQQLPS